MFFSELNTKIRKEERNKYKITLEAIKINACIYINKYLNSSVVSTGNLESCVQIGDVKTALVHKKHGQQDYDRYSNKYFKDLLFHGDGF